MREGRTRNTFMRAPGVTGRTGPRILVLQVGGHASTRATTSSTTRPLGSDTLPDLGFSQNELEQSCTLSSSTSGTIEFIIVTNTYAPRILRMTYTANQIRQSSVVSYQCQCSLSPFVVRLFSTGNSPSDATEGLLLSRQG
jgi:hypothetical protein